MLGGDGDRLSPGETECDRVNANQHVKAELGATHDFVKELPNVTTLL